MNIHYKELPTSPRYELAINKAKDVLLRLNDGFPIDATKIVELFNYELSFKYLNRKLNNHGLNFDGIALYYRNRNKYKIVMDIDSKNNNIKRFNFSLAHEIGHISLNHLNDFNTDFINDFEDDVLEHEADAFAGEILIPKEQIYNSGLSSINDLSNYFFVSKRAMEVRLKVLNIKESDLNEGKQKIGKIFSSLINSNKKQIQIINSLDSKY